MREAHHVLQVGDTTIPYAVRLSPRAARKRIVVTPGGVEVVWPRSRVPLEGPKGVLAYLECHGRSESGHPAAAN